MVRAKEYVRKVTHLAIGIAVLLAGKWVLRVYGQPVLELCITVVLLGLIVCDVLIADYGIKLPLYLHLDRPHERKCFHATTLAFLSGLLALKLFAFPVALAAIGMFIFGDAAAALAGMRAGQKLGKKSRAGMLAMFVVSSLVGGIVLGWIGIGMAVAATLAEGLVNKINDAVTIPLFAGAAGQVLLQIL